MALKYLRAQLANIVCCLSMFIYKYTFYLFITALCLGYVLNLLIWSPELPKDALKKGNVFNSCVLSLIIFV